MTCVVKRKVLIHAKQHEQAENTYQTKYLYVTI
jgi:hypothetical protein